MQKLMLDNDWTPTIDVVGISSHVRDYRLCWALNNALAISLSRTHGADSRYKCRKEESDVSYELLRNRTENGLLIPELKEADFLFFVVHGEDSEQEDHFAAIKGTQFVNAVFSLSAEHKESALRFLDLDGY